MDATRIGRRVLLGCWIRRLLVLAILATRTAPAEPVDSKEPQVAFLGIWDSLARLVDHAAAVSGVPVSVMSRASLLNTNWRDESLSQAIPELSRLRVLYVMHIDSGDVNALRERLLDLTNKNRDLKTIAIDPEGEGANALMLGDLLFHDEKAPVYWHNGGETNMVRLLRYTAATYLGDTSANQSIEPPLLQPEAGYYLPERPETFIPNFDDYKKQCPGWKDGAPVAVILIRRSFCTTNNTKVMNAQIVALRQEGFNAVALFCDDTPRLYGMIAATKPDILIEAREGTVWQNDEQPTALERLDVPYLGPVPMLASSIDQWRQDPRGLSFTDVGLFLTLQETKGVIEPIVIGGQEGGNTGYQVLEPIQERILHAAKRALARVNLRRKPAGEKKVAIIYYNDNLGKDDLMRGSATGSFLDAPASLMRFLPKLAEAAYRVEDLPRDSADLLTRVRDHGRNVGPWAQAELEEMADRGSVTLLPVADYLSWFNSKLSESARNAVIRAHGEPPGKFMVVQRNGGAYFVIPGVRLGNILLAPQPLRGQTQDEKLLHSPDIPPPHNYLAFYWWLQEIYHADAVIHWGTHGSLELLPGKQNGLAEEDWGDVCAGTIPIIDLWIMENLGESVLARRRSYAQLVDHMVPPATENGFGAENSPLSLLHSDIEKFETLDRGVLREEFRKKITEAARQQHLDETLKLTAPGAGGFEDEQIKGIHSYLHQLAESRTPRCLHVLGERLPNDTLPEYLRLILGQQFMDHVRQTLPAEQVLSGDDLESRELIRAASKKVVRQSILGDVPVSDVLREDVKFGREELTKLQNTSNEITGLLHALDGRYIAPGPGPDPIRNPASVPAGRNLYTLNPEEIPTKSSWEVAVKLIDDMLKTRLPKKVAIDMNGMSTMQDFGVNEAEALYLLGCRPVWDRQGLVRDIELIPRQKLGRPRIDVFLALGGTYKENFPTRVKLLDKAIRLVSAVKEDDNSVRADTLTMQAHLIERGFSEVRANDLANARIFGNKAGNSGTNILYLIPRSGTWDKSDEITQVYLDNMSYVYTGELWGQKIDGLYQDALGGTDTMVRTWASNVTSELSSQYSYEYFGGLNLAIKSVTGREPEALIADVRDPNGARMRDLSEVLATTLQTELLSPSWIEGMKKNAYAGAGMMAELTKNAFGWSTTRRSALGADTWDEIYQVYIEDKFRLNLKQWFSEVNPYAFQDLAATMLEASRKGFWSAGEAQLATLANLYARSVAQFGPSSGLISGGNKKLVEFVEQRLGAPGPQEIRKQFADALARSTGVAPGVVPQKVYGTKLTQEPVSTPKPAETQTSPAARKPIQTPAIAPRRFEWWPISCSALAIVLFSLGFWKRWGAAG